MMSIAAALKWLQADEKKTSSKHQDNYRHAALALLCGLLGSVGLGYAAVAYNVVANDSLASGEYAFIGYVLALYHVVMVCCRTLVKGPEELYNQMWACNAGMALATVGIFSRRRVLVGAAVAVVSIDQCLWYVDCMLKLTTGKFHVGVARYLERPGMPFVQKVTSWHHLWFLPLCIFYLRNTGPGDMPADSLKLAMSGVFTMGIISRFLTPRELNINMCFECWQDVHVSFFHIFDNEPAYIYVPWLVVMFNIVMIIPWQFMLLLVRL